MIRRQTILLIVLLIVGCDEQQKDTTYQFASLNNGIKLMVNEDEFTNRWSKFDIDVRLNKKNGNKNELFEFISNQVLQWSETEKIKIDSIMYLIKDDISNLELKIDFPETTGKEEGNTQAYTRASCLILNEETLLWKNQELKNLIVHELFHIISRYNLLFRKNMYEIIGFKVINEIPLPQSLKDIKATNPDAPMINSYINLLREEEANDYTLFIYSSREYSGGNLFDYVKFGFIKLQDLNNDHIIPVIYEEKDFSNFFEQIGNNTGYIIHPDEILADNFVFLINGNNNLPSQWVIEKMKQKLQ